MTENVTIVSTYDPTRCGLATHTKNLATDLKRLNAEVSAVDVAAIDDNGGPYHIPVNPDLVIDKNSPISFIRAAHKIGAIACERKEPSTNILNHEFGLDSEVTKKNHKIIIERCKGNNFFNMSKILGTSARVMPKERRMLNLVLYHTVPPEPNKHQRETIQGISANCDGSIVMTKVAKNFLTSDAYGIDSHKIEVIPHGVRTHDISKGNKRKKKEEYTMNHRLIITSTGLMSPAKGLVDLVRGFAKAKRSVNRVLAKKMLLLILGEWHPEFVSADDGIHYKQYRNKLHKTIRNEGLDFYKTDKMMDFINKDFEGIDVVSFEAHIPEHNLLDFYAFSDIFVANHKDLDQMHSGTVPEALGAEIPQITTKFYNALEMLAGISTTERAPYTGKIIGLDNFKGQTLGLMIDPDSPNQIARSLVYLAENSTERDMMGRAARSAGRRFAWDNSVEDLVGYIGDLRTRL